MPKAGGVHAVHEEPQLSVLVFDTQVLPQAWKPEMQTKPQAPCALQVATEFAGTGHGVHDVPHVSGLVLVAHELPHVWKPLSHENWQALPLHEICALPTAPQVLLHALQCVRLFVRSTHWDPHSVGAWPEHPLVHENPVPLGAQKAALAPQTALQDPQCVASDRSVSQPSLGFWLQSA